MAIQNFLSGGFYGSIGALTGRRWKNKRVVQKKFKPANPRTPAQQAQRNLFTRGSALAKIAQQINWKAPQFENPIRTDWNQRQTVAINALKNGMMDWEALPLAPNNFKANHIIGTCAVSKINTDNTIEFLLQGTNLETSRNYACAIFIQTGARAGQIIVGVGQSSSTDATLFTARFEDNSGISGEECFIKIASYGDEEINTVTLSAGIYLQQAGVQPYKFAPELVSVEINGIDSFKIKVKIGEEELESYDPWENIKIRLYGKMWDKNTAVNADILDEENAQEEEFEIGVERTTVAKTTATLTFTTKWFPAYVIEKFDCKLDISFDAVNVKGVDSNENSQHIELLAQPFPEYLQDELPSTPNIKLVAKTNSIVQKDGQQLLQGIMFLANTEQEMGQVIATNAQDADFELVGNTLNSVTLADGGTISGSALETLLDNYGEWWDVSDGEFAWGIADRKITSFTGTANFTCYEQETKIAFSGYRVYNCVSDGESDFNIDCTF